MRTYCLVLCTLFVLGTTAYLGCKSDSTTGPPKEQPQPNFNPTAVLHIDLIDSPAMLDSLIVRIDSVQAYVTKTDSIGTGSRWVTLNRVSSRYDILRLINVFHASIGEDSVPSGRYTQIRLFIPPSGSYIVAGGVMRALTLPADLQGRVTVNMDQVVWDGTTKVVTVDFEAARSVIRSGSPENPVYVLRPALRSLIIADPQRGGIKGQVLPVESRPIIYGYSGHDTTSTTLCRLGYFQLRSIPPGTYTLHIVPQDTDHYLDTTLTNIVVVAGNDSTSVGTITLRSK